MFDGRCTLMSLVKHDRKPAVETVQRHWTGSSRAGLQGAVHQGNAVDILGTLQPNSFDAVVTSPPYYWQRDYGVEGQIGKENTIDGYVSSIVNVMRGVRRALKREGTLFLNLGDTYYSGKGEPK